MSTLSTTERFEAYAEENPHVETKLRTLAFAKKRAGARRLSIAGLFEDLRMMPINTRDLNSPTYKISNDYKPHYARLLMERNPGLADMFVIKELWA